MLQSGAQEGIPSHELQQFLNQEDNRARILEVGDRIVDPRSIGLAYEVFKSRCAHVSNMASVVEPATIMRHGSLTGGWPEVPKRLFDFGWLIARWLESDEVKKDLILDRIYNRILLVVPIVLRHVARMTGGHRTRVFYYPDFSAILMKIDGSSR
ncbi:unnamed protein product [Heligmosomoides polygyrus]|uniref:DUF2236 domain-containing protein n=1 Tax=Heligmosomoides polygyrus TaxID=6339 RepID=A0A183GQS8_HELPZ|nr:unnamed protein product [Heligmosomoides polygyrus]